MTKLTEQDRKQTCYNKLDRYSASLDRALYGDEHRIIEAARRIVEDMPIAPRNFELIVEDWDCNDSKFLTKIDIYYPHPHYHYVLATVDENSTLIELGYQGFTKTDEVVSTLKALTQEVWQ